MPDKISEGIVTLTKRVDNLESQRSITSDVVDRFSLQFETFNTNVTDLYYFGVVRSDNQAITDVPPTPEYGVDFSGTMVFAGNHEEPGFLRLDYGHLDYDRLSYYKGGADVNTHVYVNNIEV